MDIFGFFGSVNKISLIVLLIVAALLVYEFYLGRKEKKKKNVVNLPPFNPSAPPAAPAQAPTPVIPKSSPVATHTPLKTKLPRKKISRKAVGLLASALVMMLGIGVLGYRLSQPAPTAQDPRAQVEPTTFPLTSSTSSPTVTPDISPPANNQLAYLTPSALGGVGAPTLTPLPSFTPTPFPTSIPAPTLIPSLTATPFPSPTTTTLTTLNPTGVTELPQTGQIQNAIALGALSIVIIFLSFLF